MTSLSLPSCGVRPQRTARRSVVAGLQFYGLLELRDALQQGVRLRPQRDPDNPKDSNAISLWLDRDEAEKWELVELIADRDPARRRWMLGHIKRDMAARLASLMDAGKGLDVYVDGGDRDGPWSVIIRMEGPAAEAVAAADAERDRRCRDRDDRYEAATAARALETRFPGSGWREAARLVAPDLDEPTNTWCVAGRPTPYEQPRSWSEAYKARQAELEKAFGVRETKIRASVIADVRKQRPRLERLVLRLRAKSNRRAWAGRETDLEAAAAAVDRAMTLLARLDQS